MKPLACKFAGDMHLFRKPLIVFNVNAYYPYGHMIYFILVTECFRQKNSIFLTICRLCWYTVLVRVCLYAMNVCVPLL